MAKIMVEFDSITKKLVVTQDGVAMDNVSFVSFSPKCEYDAWGVTKEDDDEFSMTICQTTEDETTEIEKRHHSYASLKTSTGQGFLKLLGDHS